MRHLVVTRFLIGKADPAAFRHGWELMRETSFLSMSRQTTRRFEWLVFTDINIPDAVADEMEEWFEATGNARLVKIDPFESGEIGKMDLSGYWSSTDDAVILTRSDDDDPVSTLLIEETQKLASGNFDGRPLCISFADGADLDVSAKQYRYSYSPFIGIGVSIVFRPNEGINPYSVSHLKLPELVRKSGGDVIEARTDTPRWIYLRRETSDSGQQARSSRMPKRDAKSVYGVDGTRLNGEFRTLLSLVGLNDDALQAIDAIEKPQNDMIIPKQVGSPMRAMSAKNQLLKLAQDIEGNETKRSAYDALLEAYYRF